MAGLVHILPVAEPSWKELIMITRAIGAALLGLCAAALHQVAHLATTLPHHQPTAAEMLLSLVTVLALFGGSATVIIGPALNRPYRWPPREGGSRN